MTSSPATNPAALLLSCGGSPQPLILSIDRQRPRSLIFFVSPQSRASVSTEIVRALPIDYRHEGLEIIETPSAELLDVCYRTLILQLPRILERWGLGWADLRADFTGGTKAMSAALVLALAGKVDEFSYVGGEDPMARDKGGVGVVVDGRERIFVRNDPWTAVIEHRLSEAEEAFRSGDFVGAANEAHVLARSGQSRRAQAIADLFQGYAHWDSQRYDAAHECLGRALPLIELAAEDRPTGSLRDLAQSTRGRLATLERTRLEAKKLLYASQGHKQNFSGVDGLAIPIDLCSAAERRAKLRNDPEDGVMLLYAAVEKQARGRLLIRHGIDNSCCPLDRLGALEKTIRARQDPEDGKVKLALTDSYRLLSFLGDEVGTRFDANQQTLKKLTGLRNHCWREHGYAHVGAPDFDGLLPQVLSFLGVTANDLTRFPIVVGW